MRELHRHLAVWVSGMLGAGVSIATFDIGLVWLVMAPLVGMATLIILLTVEGFVDSFKTNKEEA